ncbi:cytochrome c oxidase assembly protein [Kocuria dechangensis]|uniref:Cytochrome c oxidase assembly protein n=1 Tax=Kocuria dechangensis TaxID=1176249 RepID=A0A917LWZ3_9MICC|nr:cytochrome d ubiquinol oxidase subunit II [Kocuria dechangensis]GGG62642.1 cytochrome c oxidase assembly protein [Kocuria dechangensis]
MELLPTIWFIAIAVLWTGFIVLDGFDLGVGMLMLTSTRDERRRRQMLNTIGPVWDGNEVWLITAAAGLFAAFPDWYASLLSALYIPFVFVLVGLILRAVSIEYRGKGRSDRWRRWADRALGGGSFLVAFGLGAALALTTTGLPLDANGDRVGGAFAWFTPWAVLGGLALVGFCLVHASAFLALKTDGPVRLRARGLLVRLGPAALVPFVGWVVAVQLLNGKTWTWPLLGAAAVAALFGWTSARLGREGRAFAGSAAFLCCGLASVFANVHPVVLPSTLDAANDLTVTNASSGDYTLGVLTVVAGIGLPLVLLYQGWSYWVFRRRLTTDHLPAPHPVAAAVARTPAPAAGPSGTSGTGTSGTGASGTGASGTGASATGTRRA